MVEATASLLGGDAGKVAASELVEPRCVTGPQVKVLFPWLNICTTVGIDIVALPVESTTTLPANWPVTKSPVDTPDIVKFNAVPLGTF
jgi:hypothetical protein